MSPQPTAPTPPGCLQRLLWGFERRRKGSCAALTQAPLAHVQHDLAAAALQRVADLLVANLGRLIHVGHGTVVDLEMTESNHSRLA